MPRCPECNGEGHHEIQVGYCWEEPVQTEKRICPECLGKGEISKLQKATYNARGGSAPPVIKGYA